MVEKDHRLGCRFFDILIFRKIFKYNAVKNTHPLSSEITGVSVCSVVSVAVEVAVVDSYDVVETDEFTTDLEIKAAIQVGVADSARIPNIHRKVNHASGPIFMMPKLDCQKVAKKKRMQTRYMT
jgi:hypothetical protein